MVKIDRLVTPDGKYLTRLQYDDKGIRLTEYFVKPNFEFNVAELKPVEKRETIKE